jgi:hypothetical protein
MLSQGDLFYDETGNYLSVRGPGGETYKITSIEEASSITFGPQYDTLEAALRNRHAVQRPKHIRVQYQPAVEIKEITVTCSLSSDAGDEISGA